jgi:hypothetical protein
MTATRDQLVSSLTADRLFYSTGELLGADDFRAEQTYHRRQLARALLHLHGSGVVAGLRACCRHQPAAPGATDEVELEVQPGIALDHAGRLVEVPGPACLRLRRWYTFISQQAPSSVDPDAGDLRAAWRADAAAATGGVVVADVFLAFHECERGYTPTFATGPFDALDASQPSRVRDSYQLSLVLRREADADLPAASDPWAVVAGTTTAERIASAEQASMDMWYPRASAAPENPAGVDPTAVLLARLRLPARQSASATGAPEPDWSAAAWPDDRANIDNRVRRVLLPPAALRHVLGA